MIAKIKGRIDELKPTGVIIDVSGIGYELTISLRTFEKLSGQSEASLYVHTHHKEDQLKLFGFCDQTERSLFHLLTTIQGIGPSMGMSILSGISPEGLVSAVMSQNPMMLTKIPGIGKSKADKLIFELNRKARKLEELALPAHEQSSSGYEAVEALVSLGFNEGAAVTAVNGILKEKPDASIESLIKESLRLLS